jgi:D-tyrosyl-tRNA(Tyr) deacylase
VRIVVQRVTTARVSIDGTTVAEIGPGLCVFLAVAAEDTAAAADYLTDKVSTLRVFEDGAGKMNRSVIEACGQVLVVSEFTLYGDCSRGRRPSFTRAAAPDAAVRLYGYFIERLRSAGLHVAAGQFQASMQVALLNDGPVTFILDSR